MAKKKQDIIRELDAMEEVLLGSRLPLKPGFNAIKNKKNDYTLFIEVKGFKNKEQIERFIALSTNDLEPDITNGSLH